MDQFQKDVARSLNNLSIGELSPGSTDRRYEPACGLKKHRERIHKESKFADDYKNLPFTFSKPKKNPRRTYKICNNCGSVIYVNVNTVGIICSSCKQYSSVREVVDGL